MSKISKYIKQNKKKGFSDEQIKKALLDAKWKQEDINKGFKPKPKWLIPVIIIVGIIVLGLVVWSAYELFKSEPTPCILIAKICPDGTLVSANPELNCEFDPCPEIEDEFEDQKTYKNAKYGFEFKIPLNALNNNQGHCDVEEIENKITVCGDQGQYVEIFEKDSEQTLKEAIEEQFLKDYSSDKCWVEEIIREVNPNNYEYATIEYPVSTDGDFPWENWSSCPSYSRSNGISYFMADPQHPDKFTFFSIGQYALQTNDKSLWQETFKFIEINDTSNWETYKNEEYGFEVNYPRDWRADETSKEYIAFVFPGREPAPQFPGDIVISVSDNHQSLNIENYIKSLPPIITNLETMSVDNMPARKIMQSGMVESITTVVAVDEIFIHITDWQKQHQENGIYNQILSTFKFIQ